MYYFNNFYNIVGNITYKNQLLLVIENHSPSDILKFHNILRKMFKDEIILISDFKKEYFIYLVDCYDMEFKKRLINKDLKNY